MSIVNVAIPADGTQTTWAKGNIESLQGANGYGYCGPGTQLQINVEVFDENGLSLGIQGLDYLVDTATPGYDPVVGGVKVYDLVKAFSRVIRDNWSPAVRTTASEDSKKVASFKVKPTKASNGVVRIRDWIYVNQPITPA